MATWFRGDAQQIIEQQIKDKSIDLVYIDPPFATTQNKWDEPIDWKLLFKQFFRVLKDDGILAIHCSVPFNYTLIREAPKAPNYSWYWQKDNITTPLLGGKQPLRNTEEILVWYNKKGKYYSQRVGNKERSVVVNGASSYVGNTQESKTVKVKGYHQTHHITYKRDIQGFSTRPRELVELIIKSYTKEQDVILDCFCYKGLTASVAKKLQRKSVSIDKNFYPSLLIE